MFCHILRWTINNLIYYCWIIPFISVFYCCPKKLTQTYPFKITLAYYLKVLTIKSPAGSASYSASSFRGKNQDVSQLGLLFGDSGGECASIVSWIQFCVAVGLRSVFLLIISQIDQIQSKSELTQVPGIVQTLRFFRGHLCSLTSLVAQMVKHLPTMRETHVQSLVGKIL